jgi:hypothetical protein
MMNEYFESSNVLILAGRRVTREIDTHTVLRVRGGYRTAFQGRAFDLAGHVI